MRSLKMERVELKAVLREEVGKGAVKRLRKEGFIPAVCYGKGKRPLILKFNRQDLFKVLHTAAGENVIINLELKENSKLKSRTVIIKEIQYHHVNDDILHVDFNQISLTKVLTVKVPVEVKGEPIGVKEGGVLEHLLWEVDIECLPTQIPEKIDVEVSELGIGDSVHVKELIIPEGIKVLSDPEDVLLSVKPPMAEEVVKEEVEEEITEPEVIREKKPEETPETEEESEKKKAK